MITEPLVSIITPAYNAERFIEKTIKSVLAQSYQNWEHLIVIDVNSKDTTFEIVKKYSVQDPRVKLLTSPQAKGAAANRNIALEKSAGDYTAFIDADDLWTPDKLEKQITFMEANNFDFTFTSYQRIDEMHTKLGRIQKVPAQTTYSDLLINNSIACLTAVFRKKPFADIRFQEFGWEDMSFWLQILKRIPAAHSVNEPLAYYRIVRGSRSNNKFFAAKLRWNTYRLVEGFSLLKSVCLFTVYVFTSIAKYLRF